MLVRHYLANGVFWHDTQHLRQQGDLPERGRQERRRRVQPQLRAVHVRLRGRRLQRVRRLGPRRLRLLHRRDAVPEEPAEDGPQEPRQLRERARLLRHELEVRRDQGLELLQQRRRHRPEHARLRAVRAERVRRDQGQQHLLEQLQLLPAELAGEDRLGRPRRWRQLPDGIGVILFGSDGWKVQNNQIFGNFMWGAALFSDPLGNEGDDAISREQPVGEQRDGPGRHRHQRQSTSSPTAREATTASRATTPRRSRSTRAHPGPRPRDAGAALPDLPGPGRHPAEPGRDRRQPRQRVPAAHCSCCRW